MKWKRLFNFEKLLGHKSFIYPNSGTVFVKTYKNEIYGVGNNVSGGLGINTKNDCISKFKKIPINDIKIASTGIGTILHTFILTQDNTLYASGMNVKGNFGVSQQTVFEDKLYEIDTTAWLSNNEYIINIRCAQSHSLFLTSNFNVFVCGNNSYKQCAENSQKVATY